MAQEYGIDIQRWNGTDYDTLKPTPDSHADSHKASGSDPIVMETGNYGNGTITGAKIADGAVSRSKLADNTKYSPVSFITNINYPITTADSGSTLSDAYSARDNAFTFSLTQENSTNMPIGFEVAIIWRYCPSVTISFSGVRACVPGSGQIATSSSNGSVGISERYGTIAMKKVEANNTYGDMWIITGNVEVVS